MKPQVRPPIRPTRPVQNRLAPVSRRSLAELAWLTGCLAFALVTPALAVSPNSTDATWPQIWTALGLTVLGVLAALIVGFLAFRRTKNYAWLIIVGVPAFTVLTGAIIMVAVTSGSISTGQP
jgi:branched-subunit amino acid transport protein